MGTAAYHGAAKMGTAAYHGSSRRYRESWICRCPLFCMQRHHPSWICPCPLFPWGELNNPDNDESYLYDPQNESIIECVKEKQSQLKKTRELDK